LAANRYAVMLERFARLFYSWSAKFAVRNENTAINTYTIVVSTSIIVPSNDSEASSTSRSHSIVIVKIDTLS
jgi:hypothetical protein